MYHWEAYYVVPTGDRIPADGIVMEGSPSLDENRITGEVRPVDKEAGDQVHSTCWCYLYRISSNTGSPPCSTVVVIRISASLAYE